MDEESGQPANIDGTKSSTFFPWLNRKSREPSLCFVNWTQKTIFPFWCKNERHFQLVMLTVERTTYTTPRHARECCWTARLSWQGSKQSEFHSQNEAKTMNKKQRRRSWKRPGFYVNWSGQREGGEVHERDRTKKSEIKSSLLWQ